MPAVLAPADSPSEEQFTLGNVAAELELEPRRANLFGAIDDAADGPADEADGQDEPPTRPTAPPREKGVRFHCFVSERGYATSVAPKKVWPREGGYLNSVLDGRDLQFLYTLWNSTLLLHWSAFE